MLLERDGCRRTYLTAEDDTWVVIDAEGDFAEWCATRKADEIVEALWARGLPVAKVMQPHDQADIPQLVARGFFETVDHPVTGAARHPTLPFALGSRVHRRHAPLLGEHTAEVLGLTDGDVAQLEADGVIGRAPAT